MTEEELAEEYAIENWEHYEEGQNDSRALKQAYIAGYKAGKDNNGSTKWHRVADSDLPSTNRDVLSDKGDIVYYSNDGYWADSISCVELDSVIAWCEIPKYDGGEQ